MHAPFEKIDIVVIDGATLNRFYSVSSITPRLAVEVISMHHHIGKLRHCEDVHTLGCAHYPDARENVRTIPIHVRR